MGTVGEMMTAEWHDEKARFPHGPPSGGLHLALMRVSLWDAEVLEGTLQMSPDDESSVVVVGSDGMHRIGFWGDTVRVIVLPKEEG